MLGTSWWLCYTLHAYTQEEYIMFGLFAWKNSIRMLLGILAVLLVVGALLTLSGCGDSGGNITPPPATIIRAADNPTANATPAVKGNATTAPAQQKVTPPSDAYPAGTPGPYPGGASAYPSPAK
jgi:hypothetical protein